MGTSVTLALAVVDVFARTSWESEELLVSSFRKQKPDIIIIIQHYGGGSGLLKNEITSALQDQNFIKTETASYELAVFLPKLITKTNSEYSVFYFIMLNNNIGRRINCMLLYDIEAKVVFAFSKKPSIYNIIDFEHKT